MAVIKDVANLAGVSISTVSKYSHEIGYAIIAVVVLALAFIIYKGVKKR